MLLPPDKKECFVHHHHLLYAHLSKSIFADRLLPFYMFGLQILIDLEEGKEEEGKS